MSRPFHSRYNLPRANPVTGPRTEGHSLLHRRFTDQDGHNESTDPRGKQAHDSSERLRTALRHSFAAHQSFLHPEVLEASQALDKEIVRWTRKSRALDEDE